MLKKSFCSRQAWFHCAPCKIPKILRSVDHQTTHNLLLTMPSALVMAIAVELVAPLLCLNHDLVSQGESL